MRRTSRALRPRIEGALGKSRYEKEQANGLLRSFYSKTGNTRKLEVTIIRAIELRENVEHNPEHDSVLGVKEEYAAFLLEHGRDSEAKSVTEPVLPVALKALPADNAIRMRIVETAMKLGLK